MTTNSYQLTREDLLSIARAGFPQYLHNRLELDQHDLYRIGSTVRLVHNKYNYPPLEDVNRATLMSIDVRDNGNFIQFDVQRRLFNHKAAFAELDRVCDERNLIERFVDYVLENLVTIGFILMVVMIIFSFITAISIVHYLSELFKDYNF